MAELLQELHDTVDVLIKGLPGIEGRNVACDVSLTEISSDTKRLEAKALATSTQAHTADPQGQGMRYGLAHEQPQFVPPTASIAGEQLTQPKPFPAQKPDGFAPPTTTLTNGDLPERDSEDAGVPGSSGPSAGGSPFTGHMEQKTASTHFAGDASAAATELPVRGAQRGTCCEAADTQPPGGLRKREHNLGADAEALDVRQSSKTMGNGASAEAHTKDQVSTQPSPGFRPAGSAGTAGHQGSRSDRGAEASTSGRNGERPAEAADPAAAAKRSMRSPIPPVPRIVPIGRPQQAHTSKFEDIQAKTAAFRAVEMPHGAFRFSPGPGAKPAGRSVQQAKTGHSTKLTEPPATREGRAERKTSKSGPMPAPQTEFMYANIVSLSDLSCSSGSEYESTDLDDMSSSPPTAANAARASSSAWRETRNGGTGAFAENGHSNGATFGSHGPMPRPGWTRNAYGVGSGRFAAAEAAKTAGNSFSQGNPIELSSDSEDDVPLSHRMRKSVSPDDRPFAERSKQAHKPNGVASFPGGVQEEGASEPRPAADASAGKQTAASGIAGLDPKPSSAGQAAKASVPGGASVPAKAAATAKPPGAKRAPQAQPAPGPAKAASPERAFMPASFANSSGPPHAAFGGPTTSRSSAAALAKLAKVNPKLAKYFKAKYGAGPTAASASSNGTAAHRPAWPEANLPASNQGRGGQGGTRKAGSAGAGKRAGATKPDWGAAATWFHTQGPDLGAPAATPQARNGASHAAAAPTGGAPRAGKTTAVKQTQAKGAPAAPARAREAKQPAKARSKEDPPVPPAKPHAATEAMAKEATAASRKPFTTLPTAKEPPVTPSPAAEAAESPMAADMPRSRASAKFRPVVPPRKRTRGAPAQVPKQESAARQANGDIPSSPEGTAESGSGSDSPPARTPAGLSANEGGPSPFVIVLDDSPTPEKDLRQASKEQAPVPGSLKQEAQEGPVPMDVEPAVQDADQLAANGGLAGEPGDDDEEGDWGQADFGAVAEMRREELREERADADEAEWEMRRKEIERQAEMARRLKKRRRMEAEVGQRTQARLEDHRRQLALEEQAISEREQLRTSIRAELQARTKGFKSLVGILMALGIEVEGRHMATAQQLTKAHRKAMLQFHPDKFASAPMADQVRAEELFKIISHAPKPGAR